jgi:hypothetical protein
MKGGTGDCPKKEPGGLWKVEPEAHDFPAAAVYLSLVIAEPVAASLVEALRTTATTESQRHGAGKPITARNRDRPTHSLVD